MQKNQNSATKTSPIFGKCFSNVYVKTQREAQSKTSFCIECLNKKYETRQNMEAYQTVRDVYEHFSLIVNADSSKWYVDFISYCKGLAGRQGVVWVEYLAYIKTVDFLLFREKVEEKQASMKLVSLN